jgi:hypothetical protein
MAAASIFLALILDIDRSLSGQSLFMFSMR